MKWPFHRNPKYDRFEIAEMLDYALKRCRDFYSEGWDDGFNAGKGWQTPGQVTYPAFLDPKFVKPRDMKKMNFPVDDSPRKPLPNE